MSVRLGTLDDLPALLALDHSVPTAPHWGKDQYCAALCAVEASPVTRSVLVWDDGAGVLGFAVGMVLCACGVCEGELESVVVRAAERRRGIGIALCRAVVVWCAAQHAGVVSLEVRASSQGAIILYCALGFVTAGRRAGYYREPNDDALLMRLPLA